MSCITAVQFDNALFLIPHPPAYKEMIQKAVATQQKNEYVGDVFNRFGKKVNGPSLYGIHTSVCASE